MVLEILLYISRKISISKNNHFGEKRRVLYLSQTDHYYYFRNHMLTKTRLKTHSKYIKEIVTKIVMNIVISRIKKVRQQNASAIVNRVACRWREWSQVEATKNTSYFRRCLNKWILGNFDVYNAVQKYKQNYKYAFKP